MFSRIPLTSRVAVGMEFQFPFPQNHTDSHMWDFHSLKVILISYGNMWVFPWEFPQIPIPKATLLTSFTDTLALLGIVFVFNLFFSIIPGILVPLYKLLQIREPWAGWITRSSIQFGKGFRLTVCRRCCLGQRNGIFQCRVYRIHKAKQYPSHENGIISPLTQWTVTVKLVRGTNYFREKSVLR